ncbi:MAG: NAD(P)/FAD-dependent oxidoreductase [Gemmatimonadaceae bacterium]|nr:NAD(P)/FAD-dependent oxidoreductase [Gemmatimonadaceae bacterium]
MSYDVIVIGAGVNGLTTATLLARAGRKVLVVEQRDVVGGVCATEEFHPGFRANICVDDPGWMPAPLAELLGLARHGYAPTFAPAGTVIPVHDAAPVVLDADPSRGAAALQRIAPRDAARWTEFCTQLAALSGMLAEIYSRRAPLVGSTAPRDLWDLLSSGRRLRKLGRRGMIDFLRAVPMEVADYLDEWFEHPALKGALSFGGIRDVQHGPMSGGTTLVLLHHHVGMPLGLVNGRRVVTGGVAALPLAIEAAARAAGVEIRCGAEVIQVVTRDDRVAGVVLVNGERLVARTVACSADVRRTFMLVEPGLFDPGFLHAVDHVRMRGPSARVHLAVDGDPGFGGASPWPREALAGSITIAPTMAWLERAYDAAKHGGMAESPGLQVTVPTVLDPGLAPAGKHVVTIHAQYAAHDLRAGWTPERRVALGAAVMRALAPHAPDLGRRTLHMDVRTPADLAREYLVTEGSVLHGELALDQFLFMRPVPACARHAAPLNGLWLCGSSTHPGAGTAGVSGWFAAREILRESA